MSKSLLVSVLNQVVSSGTNFVLGLYLVRALSPDEFGLYGIGFALIMFYMGAGNALLLTQMVVLIPEKMPEDRPHYVVRMFFLTGVFCFFSLTLSCLVFFVGGLVLATVADYAWFGVTVTLAAVSCLQKEFFLRYAYCVSKEIRALVCNVIFAIALFIGLAWTIFFNIPLSPENVFISMSIANGISMFVGVLQARLPLRKMNFYLVIEDARGALDGGIWSVFAHVIISIRTQAYTLIVASMMGPASVARLNAARIFITPAAMLTPALGQVFLPRLAATRADNPQKGYLMAMRFSAILLGIALIYSVSILILYPYIFRMVVGSKYESLFLLVLFWCAYSCLSSLRSGQEIALVAYKLFKAQAYANVLAAGGALLLVYLLFGYFGEAGAIGGLCISEAIVVLMLWRLTGNGRIVKKGGARCQCNHG